MLNTGEKIKKIRKKSINFLSSFVLGIKNCGNIYPVENYNKFK